MIETGLVPALPESCTIRPVTDASASTMSWLGEEHLRHLLAEYSAYYNGARTHLALHKDTPLHRPALAIGGIASVSWLGGLHRQYVRMA